MAPPDVIANPESENCVSCPQNAFGSADTGKGKACRNGVRVVILPYNEDTTLEDLRTQEGARFTIAPKSLGNWSNYAKKLASLKRPRPLFLTITKITADFNPYLTWNFDLAGVINSDAVRVVLQKRVDEECRPMLAQLPAVAAEDGDSRQKKRGRGRRAASGKK